MSFPSFLMLCKESCSFRLWWSCQVMFSRYVASPSYFLMWILIFSIYTNWYHFNLRQPLTIMCTMSKQHWSLKRERASLRTLKCSGQLFSSPDGSTGTECIVNKIHVWCIQLSLSHTHTICVRAYFHLMCVFPEGERERELRQKLTSLIYID